MIPRWEWQRRVLFGKGELALDRDFGLGLGLGLDLSISLNVCWLGWVGWHASLSES